MGFCKKLKLKSFTLSEILMTLVIVGTIASMTIPQLMQDIQDNSFKQSAREAFSKSSQALQQMRLDNGGTVSQFIGNAHTFKPEFIKYFKVIKDCGYDSCIHFTYDSEGNITHISDIFKTLAGYKGGTGLLDDGQFITQDGMFYGIENSTGNYIYITVDVNGIGNKPNVFGRDIFTFQVLNDNLYPMGSPKTNYISSSYCSRSATGSVQGIGCMYYVMRNINY